MTATKFITFYRTYSSLGLLISKANNAPYLAISNDGSSSIRKSDIKFPSSKSNCTDLNKWHVISVDWKKYAGIIPSLKKHTLNRLCW